MPSAATATAHRAAGRRFSLGVAQAWTGAILMTFLAASSAPSPLYALYREAWGFSALALTAVFSSYALALLVALLVFGALSDYVGRRPMVLAALALQLVATMLFWQAESLGWLLAARVVQGIATGVGLSALSALLLDLEPRRGALINGVAPMVGMAVGALGTSVLVQFAPAPMRLVYELLLVVLVVQAIASLRLPDTVPRRPGAGAAMRPRLAVPRAARAALWRVLPINTASWALTGLVLALGPTLLRQIGGNAAPLAGGALIATLVAGAALANLLAQRWPAARALALAARWMVAGLLATLAGVYAGSAPLLFCGVLLAGIGMGISFSGALRSLVPLAPPAERAGLMASFLVCSYLSFSVPVLLAGVATGWFGLRATALGYGGALLLLAVLTWLFARDTSPAAATPN